MNKNKKIQFVAGKQCAPGRTQTRTTCFSAKELRSIASAYNTSLIHRRGGSYVFQNDQKIHFTQKTATDTLWHQIQHKLKQSTNCNTEKCWSKQFQETKHLGGSVFRPDMPTSWHTNKTEWLSTTDIEVVMKQYEVSHTSFHFIGAVPVDFESSADSGEMGKCVTQALCNAHVKHWMKKGLQQIGIVFNLDPHYESGSHWVSAFLDISDNKVLYYDSFGSAPPYEINTFLNKIASQLEDVNESPCSVRVNENRHQFKNTECGIYSMYFIASMLDGVSYNTFVGNGLTDAKMQKYRHIFYNTLDNYEQEQLNDSSYINQRHRGGGRSIKQKTPKRPTRNRNKSNSIKKKHRKQQSK